MSCSLLSGQRSLFAALGMAALVTVAMPAQTHAIELYRISTAPSTLNNGTYDPARVTITTAANVSGSSATDLSATETLSNIFANDNTAGGFGVFRITDDNGVSIDNAGEFSGGFMTFRVEADENFSLGLDSLTFNANRGGTAETRGFEIYATIDDEPFLFGTSLALLDVGNELGTRTTPTPHSIDLSGAEFQGASSITFRVYALTSATGSSIEFAEFVLNGSAIAIPEPATGLLGLAGLAALAARRRRQVA